MGQICFFFTVFVIFKVAFGDEISLITETTTVGEADTNFNQSLTGECENYLEKSCSGSCGEFYSLPCSCDEYCQVFNRCCLDYHAVCPSEALQAREKHSQLMTTTFQCVTVPVPHIPEMVINSCPADSTHHLQSQCEHQYEFDILPIVMSKTSRLHFKNIYCLMCNNEDDSNVEYWQVVAGTDNRRELPRGSIDKLYPLLSKPKTYIPPADTPVLACSNQVISTCPVEANPSHIKLCETSSLSMVKRSGDRKVYKNIYCLICNSKSLLAQTECQQLGVNDLIYSGRQPMYSYLLNWNKGIATVEVGFPQHVIQEFQCWYDTGTQLQCKVTKCYGTYPLLNGKCMTSGRRLGCAYFPFKLRLSLKQGISNNSLWFTVNDIVRKINSVLVEYETDLNVTRLNHSNYISIGKVQYNGFVNLNISINMLMYNPCTSNLFEMDLADYQTFLEDHKYQLGFHGQMFVSRLTFKCENFCSEEFQYTGDPSHTFIMNATNQNTSNKPTQSALTAIVCLILGYNIYRL